MGDSSRDQRGGGEIACIWQCVCVCLVGKQGCSRDTMGHLHQKGSKRGCTHGTQVKAGHNGDYKTEAKAEEAEGEGAAPELRREQ